MKIHVGCGGRLLNGFLNFDVDPKTGADRLGHAANLRSVASGSASFIFSNAVFEHVFLGQQLFALEEHKRVLGPSGTMLFLGIPDFKAIARLYLEGAPGISSPRFELFDVYRYSHGDPERSAPCNWSKWNPARRTNTAPKSWLPQLHKCLFDAGYLLALFEQAGLKAQVFHYAYPGESHALNLGTVVGKTIPEISMALAQVPNVEIFIQPESIQISRSAPQGGELLKQAIEWAQVHGQGDSFLVRGQRFLKRFVRQFST